MMAATMLSDAPARVETGAHADQASAMRLGVLIGDRRWLVELGEAGEIVPLPAITSVPQTRDWFRGLVNLRGALYTVVDLARFSGAAPIVADKDTRLLALGAKLNFNASILVSRMLGLRSTAGMRPRAGHGDAGPRAAWQGPVWTDDAGVAWQELDLAALVQDERFLQVGR